MPSLAEQYGIPPEDPNEVEIVPNGPKGPSADQILDQYIAAVGGEQKLEALKSFVGKGTFEGYNTNHLKVGMEVYASAPGQRTQVVHVQIGDSTETFDGKAGWVASVDRPVKLLPDLPGYEADAAKLDADLTIPVHIKTALMNWKSGFPPSTIDDKDMQTIEGFGAGGTRFKLYFNQESGLLTRQLRYENTAVGTVPIQVDYGDYRDVAGVKIPFKWVVTWTNGQSTNEFTEVQANAPIDAARFAKPAEAVLKPLPK